MGGRSEQPVDWLGERADDGPERATEAEGRWAMDRPTSSRSGRQARAQRATQGTETHAVRVVAVRHSPPDLDRPVAALLARAMAELEAKRRPEPDARRPTAPRRLEAARRSSITVAAMKRAAIYLRVSTAAQAKRDREPEGY